MTQEQESIGLIGLGLVGSALAARLLEQGYAVVGCDIDADKTRALEASGGTTAPTPAAVAASLRTLFKAVTVAPGITLR